MAGKGKQPASNRKRQAGAGDDVDLTKYQHASPDKPFSLARIGADERPCSSGDSATDRKAIDRLAVELDEWQNLFYADRRRRMLVVLQGMDTSGKDGTLRHVFNRMSPLGVRTVAWKAPNDSEKAHEPLWRIQQRLPADGEVVIFNRSHYEDVLVPVVLGQLTQVQTQQRYAHINDFERMLTETGTVICKFMLHISKGEQRKRLQDRLDDPDKRWKFDPNDLVTRRQWDAYQHAYDAALRATGTPWAPWTVVPADSKTHRNLMIAMLLKRRFQSLEMDFPPLPAELEGLVVD